MDIRKLKELCEERDHLKVYEFLANRELRIGGVYTSPMRDRDRKPSFSVYRSKEGKVLWKDFAFGEGDVYAAVMLKYGCGFRDSVIKVAGILGVTEDQILKPKGGSMSFMINKAIPKKKITDCTYMETDLSDDHVRFLNSFGITDIEYARRSRWIPISSGSARDRVTGEGTSLGPARGSVMWAILIGKSIKFYRPGADKMKYFGNSVQGDVYGIEDISLELPTLICAGHKDKMVGSYHLSGLANVICFNSESIIPDEMIILDIFRRSKSIYVWYDNDKAGMNGTKKIIDKYPFVQPIYHMSELNDLSQIAAVEGGEAVKREFKRQTFQ